MNFHNSRRKFLLILTFNCLQLGVDQYPPNCVFRPKKPDLAIEDKKNKMIHLFELSVICYMSPRNHSAMYTLHKFMKPRLKLAQFKKNVSALSFFSSYYIFITRKEPLFCKPPCLLPTFKDQ